MSNDIKTLENAQPGGRVRLNREPRAHRWDDVGERCLDCGDKDWMGGPCSGPHQSSPGSKGDAWAINLARESAFGHSNDHAYLPQTRDEANGWQPHEWVVAAIQAAALTAHPCPGGQDAITSAMVDAAAGVLAKWAGHEDGSRWVHEARDALKAALAASQPAGEPAIWVSPGQLSAHKDRVPGDGGSYLPARLTRDGQFTKPLYATPTQGMDLDELRRAVCVVNVVGQIDGHDVVRRNSVLDVIDTRRQRLTESQAVQP
ncbi:hypothetical protein [Stenotrophomonas maltophilia]|uniref:hypothetical protein n=1 Tax=Stenotrophomonas maltophilia TaxID=40324 RepID=UPI0021C9829B|nr:hypothetical protein [Stenotrophomonas maltophilia]MCU1145453.1 hypothetical protein [Stenotrophomonas maltophilia]